MAATSSASRLEARLLDAYRELEETRDQRDDYHIRLTKAEQEAAEWKARFDLLLSKCKLSAEEA